MAVKLNKDAFEHAKQLIKDGKFVADDQDKWSEHQPDTEGENQYIDAHGMEAFGKWYLGVDTDDEPENKGYYKFPFGDFEKVHRGGLVALKQRAAQYDYDEVQKAGDELFEMIENKSDGE